MHIFPPAAEAVVLKSAGTAPYSPDVWNHKTKFVCSDAQALILASAFQETAKLAKRIQELEVMDAQLEGYRQMLRAAIAFQRRRRVPRNRLDSIPEICAEPEDAADEG